MDMSRRQNGISAIRWSDRRVFIFHHLIRDCCWFGCLAASQIADADNVRMTAFGRTENKSSLILDVE
jgi:hypothetical protein